MTNLVEKQMGASIIVNTGTKSFFQSLEHGRLKKESKCDDSHSF